MRHILIGGPERATGIRAARELLASRAGPDAPVDAAGYNFDLDSNASGTYVVEFEDGHKQEGSFKVSRLLAMLFPDQT